MSLIYQTKQHTHVQLDESKPLGKGGEGCVYSIINTATYPNHCAKIFYPNRLTPELEQKINFMVDNPPDTLTSTNYRIAWPIAALYQKQKFCGFIMPKAFDQSIGLERLTQPHIHIKNIDQSWIKYQRSDKQGVINCFKVCVNIAFTVNLIHQMQKYIFVDLKPQNILVTLNGFISITDIDSMQVYDDKKNLYYKSVVSTAEYSPPEYRNYLKSGSIIAKEWDNFSLAVIFYQLITGIHPFAATFGDKFHDSTTIDDHISRSLFVFGNHKHAIVQLPKLHKYYERMPADIQQLFLRAFDKPVAQRPNAEEWGKNLFDLVSQKQHLIAHNPDISPASQPKKPVGGLNQAKKINSALKPVQQQATQPRNNSAPIQISQPINAQRKSYAWIGWLIVVIAIIGVILLAQA
ncbi:protein kinase [Herpetosiphon sp. NSE202]|uniref:protein kinase domain-containing protein n=1 Tax=Herpetosiphon sp. NSE202 TaxID=3351349 RepID=UPI0036436A8B